MEKTISAADANRQFSRLLRDVRKGESFTVTSHGEPVARIVPTGTNSTDAREAAKQRLLQRLRSQPALNSGSWSRDEAYDDDL
jgi:prevent-host-death family protein